MDFSWQTEMKNDVDVTTIQTIALLTLCWYVFTTNPINHIVIILISLENILLFMLSGLSIQFRILD